jgi:O-antigen ligase
VLYLLVGLVSISWAFYPYIAFKHWFKAVGDVAMVLVIGTDAEPLAAFRRLVSRVGIFLFPASILFIKYFPDLGRGYTDAGLLMNTGVTTNKNSLGLIVLVVSVVILWNVRWLFIHKDEPNRGRRLLAQCTLLAFGLILLWMANSSTSKACFFLGGLIIFTLNLRVIRRQPSRVHVFYLFMMLAAGTAFLFGGQADVADALGRDPNLSGRTAIWEAVIPAVPNRILGAGFESFWVSPNVQIFQRTLLELGWYPPLVKVLNEAHNGYIEVYLNLGWVGVFLIALVLAVGYRRASRAFRLDPELGSLFLAYVAIAAVYGITEAAFRFMCLAWIFLLLASVGATGVTAGFFAQVDSKVPASRSDELLPESETYHTAWQEFHSL